MLTTAIFATQSCSMADDGDMDSPMHNGLDNMKGDNGIIEVLASNCITLPGYGDPLVGLDSLSNDTLKIFPDDEVFHKLLMQSMLSAQGMVKIIARSIDASVNINSGNAWMTYTDPYLGVFTSVNDSRSKQWYLEKDVEYNDVQWDFHLSILDLPEGVATDNNGERAVEVFYNGDLKNGVMIFSPTDFDAVRFPTKIFGPDIKGVLIYSNDGNVVTNELYLTNIGIGNNVKYIRNVYLRSELSNGCIAIQTMIDFPALWFDVRENCGFTVSSVGACDVNTGGTVMYAGIVRNSSKERTVESLVVEHPSDEVLAQYYPLWIKMLEDSTPSSDTLSKSAGFRDVPPTEEVPMEEKNAEGTPTEGYPTEGTPSEEETYGKPGYYLSGVYVPTSAVTDKSPYLKALNKCIDMMDGEFPISPYKNSVNQIEWSSDKSR